MQVNKNLTEALRRNRLKQTLPDVLEKLSTILGRSVETMRVESALSEEMFQSYLQKRSSCREGRIFHFRLYVAVQDKSKVEQVITKLRTCSLALPMWLYRRVGRDIVAVETTNQEILGHAFELISLDDDTLYVATADFSHAVELDYSLERIPGHSRKIYQLIVWGAEFLKVLIPEWERGVGKLCQAPW